MEPIVSSSIRRLNRLLLALVCLGTLATGLGQVTTETVDLVGPVATVTEFHEYPGTRDRVLMHTWSYRSDGTALEHVYLTYSFMDGSFTSRIVTTYDDAGNRLATVTMDPEGNPLAQTVFRYDERGDLVEEASYDAEGAETRRVTYERNAEGNVVVQERFVAGVLDERTEFDYDAQGRELEEREYEEGQLTGVRTYTEPGLAFDYVQYDDEGQVKATRTVVGSEHGTELLETYDGSGALEWRWTWTYDDNGLLLERREVNGEGDDFVYTYEYEFDENGNWIRMVVTEVAGSSPDTYEIRDREITYH